MLMMTVWLSSNNVDLITNLE